MLWIYRNSDIWNRQGHPVWQHNFFPIFCVTDDHIYRTSFTTLISQSASYCTLSTNTQLTIQSISAADNIAESGVMPPGNADCDKPHSMNDIADTGESIVQWNRKPHKLFRSECAGKLAVAVFRIVLFMLYCMPCNTSVSIQTAHRITLHTLANTSVEMKNRLHKNGSGFAKD